MRVSHPYWIARGVALLSAAIVLVFTVWDPIGIVRGSALRPACLQVVGAVGLFLLLALPDRILASTQTRYRLAQVAALLCMAAVVNQINWLGVIPPALAIDGCRSRFKMKERIRAVARDPRSGVE